MIFEVFADEGRTMLLDRVVQTMVAPLENVSGCVEVKPDIMLFKFPELALSKIPIEKIQNKTQGI